MIFSTCTCVGMLMLLHAGVVGWGVARYVWSFTMCARLTHWSRRDEVRLGAHLSWNSILIKGSSQQRQVNTGPVLASQHWPGIHVIYLMVSKLTPNPKRVSVPTTSCWIWSNQSIQGQFWASAGQHRRVIGPIPHDLSSFLCWWYIVKHYVLLLTLEAGVCFQGSIIM